MATVNQPETQAPPQVRKALPVWITLIAGTGVSLIAYFLAHQQEVWRAETEFLRRSDLYQAALHASLNQHLESLHGMQRLVQLSSNLDYTLFRDWARDIVTARPEIQVVEWCPRVAKAERVAYEAAGQSFFPGFSFVERDAQGRNIPVADRDEYFPILYFEPIAGNEVVAGFDVMTGQAAREMERARDSGQPAASGRIRMVQNIGDQFGLIVTLPVYRSGIPLETVEQKRAAFRGGVRGVFRIRDLFKAAWRTVPSMGVDTLVLDPTVPTEADRFILFHPSKMRKGSASAPTAPTETEFRTGRHHESSLRIGARTWTFLFRPVPEWWDTQFSWLPYFILVGGFGTTLLVAAYVRSSIRRTELIESTVAERTAALSREVSERRRAEEELRKAQSTLVRAQRIGRVGSWESDLVHRTLAWSDETFRIFGHEPGRFQPTVDAFFASVHSDDRERVRKTVRAAIEHNRRYDVEHRIRRPDGSECFVHEMAEVVQDENGKPARLIGTVQDITERHYADERLEWERNLLRTLIDNVPDYIYFKDREGRFIIANAASQRVLGVHAVEDILGKTVADFLPAEVAALYAAGDAQILATGHALINQEEPLITRTGEKRYLLTTKIPLRDARGQVIGIVGVSRDITERKNAEDERQMMERKFQETQKLESLGVLAGGIAHDFNNLLTGILGNASLARMELPPEASLNSYLEQIELSSQRAADLCKQMLAYSGKGRFVIQRIDLSALVRETLHLLQLSITKKAVLKLDLADGLPGVMADATQIRQIIMNLVMNASDAIGEKSGLITISTSRVNVDLKYLEDLVGAAELQAGEYVVLEVTDNGSGMSAETRAKIFEPFFTTKFTGRGLGLAAVLGIVRGHKGALKVYSELGRGSTFKLLLPAAGVSTGDTRLDRRFAPEWRGSGTVLVVDDEESVRMVAGRMLKTLGFDVLTAENGERGLQVYRAHADTICAVLLDLTMPKMDGEETFRELRRMREGACVVLMSGFNEQEAGARFVGKGLAGFLQKPFTPDELRERLAAFGKSPS
jgi:PAS domain S-box-containing protein